MSVRARENERNGQGGTSPLRLLAFSAALLLAAAVPPEAAVPVKFTYQGNLRQNGFLVNGTRGMSFRLYDSSGAAAALLWTSPDYSVEVSTGVFRVTLEPVVPDWESGSLWLELVVESVPMSPREEITSSPYAVNSLLVGGKRYTTAASAPSDSNVGDLWMDTVTGTLKFWNGSLWMLTSGSGVPGVHAYTHGPGSSDPITALGTHTVTGKLVFDAVGAIEAAGGVAGLTISTHVFIGGVLNPYSSLAVGGPGYGVSIASAVAAGWFHGDGSGLTGLNASHLASGWMNGDRLAPGVLVSSHIADGSLTRFDLGPSGCANGQVLKWDNAGQTWICSDDSIGAGGGEMDPLSVHNQDTLQANTTFYVSSGTVNYFTVNERFDSYGPSTVRRAGSMDYLDALSVYTPGMADGLNGGLIRFGRQDAPNQSGYISFVGGPVAGSEYISIGIKNAETILAIAGDRGVGIGTSDPLEPLELSSVGGGAGIRFNSPGSAEYKIGVPVGGDSLLISNTDGLAKG
ncbi:MAG TPA: hypothetical protein PK523_09175, partial [Elusimicrobiales bacterium]|nr:hypothetical protein [Elusimicrobiales bacterium]